MPRVFDAEQLAEAVRLRQELATRSTATLLTHLDAPPKEATLAYHLRKAGVTRKALAADNTAHPRYEADAPNEELRQAWEYYHTPRAQYPTSPGYMTARSLDQIIPYDAYAKAEAFLTQPLQIIAGSEAGSKWMSDDLYARAASTEKHFHIVKGANHMDLYDGKDEIAEAVGVLAPFFEKTLRG